MSSLFPFFKKDDRRVMYELILKAIKNKEINLIDDGSALGNTFI